MGRISAYIDQNITKSYITIKNRDIRYKRRWLSTGLGGSLTSFLVYPDLHMTPECLL